MLAVIRSNWRILKTGTPGKRFQEMNRARRRSRRGSGTAQRVITLILGGVLVVAGPIAGMIPGPGGILLSLLGWALLASELLVVARWLDWCEPRVRRYWSRNVRAWKQATATLRTLVCLGAASIVVMIVLAVRWYAASG